MTDAFRKITGLILMMIGAFFLLFGVFLVDLSYRALLIVAGIVLIVLGFVMYRLMKDSDE